MIRHVYDKYINVTFTKNKFSNSNVIYVKKIMETKTASDLQNFYTVLCHGLMVRILNFESNEPQFKSRWDLLQIYLHIFNVKLAVDKKSAV